MLGPCALSAASETRTATAAESLLHPQLHDRRSHAETIHVQELCPPWPANARSTGVQTRKAMK
eukprot:1925087-Amphidinium_carterae.1